MSKRGGARPGAGRKPKAEEDKMKQLCMSSMKAVFGSEEKAIEHGWKLAKDSFNHFKLMMEYTYGKPKETVDMTHNLPKPTQKVFEDWSKHQ